jgi:L-ribulokinase
MMGMEAGQSAFGDAYAWFRNILVWPLQQMLADSTGLSKQMLSNTSDTLISVLSEKAAQLPFDEKSELSMDWFNGRRTPDANQLLKGALTGLSLGTDAPRIFRAIAEGTCFGAKSIVDRFIQEEVPVKGLIGLGGVARKSAFIMQMMADVMNMPIRIHRSEQTCALGAAMFAATASGIHSCVEQAMEAMGQGFDKTYLPNLEKAGQYAKRYQQYKHLGNFVEQQTNQ